MRRLHAAPSDVLIDSSIKGTLVTLTLVASPIHKSNCTLDLKGEKKEVMADYKALIPSDDHDVCKE